MLGEGTQQQRVSLAELLEVRTNGLTPSELLSVLSSSCEYLINDAKCAQSNGKLFSLNQMFVTRNGRVEIPFTFNLAKQFMPPELLEQNYDSDKIESQLVWCLGMSCLRVFQSSHSDVSLFSLLNFMTVGQVQSRPTLSKVRQMVRNQLGVVGLAKVPEIISSLFNEVMGDLDELLADAYDDDIRFSSSRSSKMSIIPGPGAPEQQQNSPAGESGDQHQSLLISEAADRLRRELPDQSKMGNPEFEINSVDIPEKMHLEGQFGAPLQLHSAQQQKMHEYSADEDGGPTPRSTTPVPKSEQMHIVDEGKMEEVPSERQNKVENSDQTIVDNQAVNMLTKLTQNALPQPHKPAGRLYAKAAQIGKVPRAVSKKEPEIEILLHDSAERRVDAFLDMSDGSAVCGSTVPPVTGYSPGTRRKGQQDGDRDSQWMEEPVEEQSAQFHRKNSLEPKRCSKRRESCGQRKTLSSIKSVSQLPTVPEFLSPNVQPIIRLRAQSMKRKKMVSLHRSDPAVVYVRLLNGNIVEVNCRTDASVGSVFHTVAEHLNITEHLFFGLTLQRPFGENIFLEEHQRLEKWAPPGWKGGPGLRRSFGAGGSLSRQWAHSVNGDEKFTVLLRFRYYPKKRQFVKTAITAHQLYLQLRQDILSGTLRFLPRERAMEMAALALCAEAHALPKADEEYFRLDDYLPTKFFTVESNEVLPIQQRVAELHQRLAASFGYLEAEEQFITRCQTEPLYGAHFYRVHKIKQKRGYSAPSKFPLSDMRIIAVIPSGIAICREEHNGTQRLLNSTHEWHTIRTLQFDRKRFLLGTIEGNIAVDHVFYTDHHSKASYLVRFAASQHRFMLKMRQWQGTLNKKHMVQWQNDVGVEQGSRSEEVAKEHQLGAVQDGRQTHARNTSYPQMGIGQKFEAVSLSDQLSDNNNQLMFETEREYIEYFYGSEAQQIDVLLEKDPVHGLGLTLIDGDMNGIKTVFVKSLSPEGEGQRKGLLVGDCLLSVNGVSLFNKSRHDAVHLVASCAREVLLQFLRFPSVSEVLANGSPPSYSPEKDAADRPDYSANSQKNGSISSFKLRRPSFNASAEETRADQKRNDDNLRKVSAETNEKLSSISGGTSHSAISSTQKRQRAVSDFGASYLPALRTDDILALGSATAGRINERPPERYRRHKTNVGFRESNSKDSDSDSNDGRSEMHQKSTVSARRGEYKPRVPPAMSMYSFLGDDEEEEGHILSKSAANVRPNNVDQRLHGYLGECFSTESRNNPKDSPTGRSPFASAVERFARVENATDAISWNSAKLSAKNGTLSKGNNSSLSLDWANCLSDVNGPNSSSLSSSPSPRASPPSNRKHKKFTVRIARVTSTEFLPFKVRSVPGKGIFVREINAAEIPQSVTLRVDDRIIAVDGVSVIGYNWENIIDNIICDEKPVKSELELTVERTVREEDDEMEEQTLLVTLDKTQNGAIGLSLAKRMGSDGVFVRNIASDSIAAREGTLQVGDRVWRVQGEQIAVDESPANVVRRLKDLSGQFSIEVRRKRE